MIIIFRQIISVVSKLGDTAQLLTQAQDDYSINLQSNIVCAQGAKQ